MARRQGSGRKAHRHHEPPQSLPRALHEEGPGRDPPPQAGGRRHHPVAVARHGGHQRRRARLEQEVEGGGAAGYRAVLHVHRPRHGRASVFQRSSGPSPEALLGSYQIYEWTVPNGARPVHEVHGTEAFVLRFLQCRDDEWIGKVFFAKFDPKAIWYDDLEPLPGMSLPWEEAGLPRPCVDEPCQVEWMD